MKELALAVVEWLYGVLTHKLFLLAIGGALGTVARYRLSQWIQEKDWAAGFPLGTLVVNISGSFVLGFTYVIIRQRLSPAHQDWFFLFGTGFCGGYTTFSTFAFETFALVQDGSGWAALGNVALSVIGGIVAVVLGVVLANLLFPRS